MSRFARILVATDGSPSCRAAIEAAIELAAALGAELLALSVADDPDATDLDLSSSADPLGAAEAATMALTREDEAAREAAAASRAADVADAARTAGISARALAWEGAAGPAIVAAATAEHADLVVVGSHCRGSVRRIVSGSVSEHVVRHSPVPVLVVRASD